MSDNATAVSQEEQYKSEGKCIAHLKEGGYCGVKVKPGTEYCGRHPNGKPVERAPRGSRQTESPSAIAAAVTRGTPRGACGWCGEEVGEEEVRLQHQGQTSYFHSASCAAMHLLLEEPELFEGVVQQMTPFIKSYERGVQAGRRMG